MAFNKNWKQFIVSKGEPFQIEYLNRSFGNRSRVVFKVDDETGNLTVNGRLLAGTQNIVGDIDATGTITGGDLAATDDLTVGGDSALAGNLAVAGTSAFTGAVTLPANTVTGANLATALAAQIPMTATLTLGGSAGAPTVTIQLKDARGTNMALACKVDVWVSAAAKATPIGTDTTNLTTTFTTGTIALTKLTNLDYDIISNGSGVIVAVLTDADGATTRYVNVAVNGVVYASAAVVSPA